MLMLPGAILLIAFMAYPFFLGIWLSLTDSMIGRAGQFIGLQEFYGSADRHHLSPNRPKYLYLCPGNRPL